MRFREQGLTYAHRQMNRDTEGYSEGQFSRLPIVNVTMRQCYDYKT